MKTFLTIVFAATSISALAQSPITTRLNSSASVTVSHPDALEQRLTPPASAAVVAADSVNVVDDKTAVARRTGGYRVQMFSDNNSRTAKDAAYAKARIVADAFPDYPTYVVYNSPYWRLRVGDFRTHDEAEAAAALLKARFPENSREIRVVHDRINVK